MECNVKVVTKMEFLITMPLLFQVKGFYTKMEFNHVTKMEFQAKR